MKPRDLQSVHERKKEKQLFAHKIGQHLQKARKSKGISQENLSLQAGYYRTYVGKIEKGNYSPSQHTIWRLANSLGLTLEEFFKGF